MNWILLPIAIVCLVVGIAIAPLFWLGEFLLAVVVFRLTLLRGWRWVRKIDNDRNYRIDQERAITWQGRSSKGQQRAHQEFLDWQTQRERRG